MTTQVATGGGKFARRSPIIKKASGSIEQTLGALGISADVSPELAVQEASENMASDPGHPIEDINGRATTRRPSSKQALPPPTPLQHRPSARRPAPAQASVAPAAQVHQAPQAHEAQQSTQIFEEAEEQEGFQLPFASAPSVIKGRPTKPSPALGKLGVSIAAMMPGAERVRVEKRLPTGQLGFIADYSKQDLASHPDLQSFLSKYVKDQYGPGEYKVTGLDSTGRNYEAGSVHLLDPPSRSEQSGALHIMQNVIAQQQKNHEEQIKEIKETMQAQPNPVSTIRELHNLQKEIMPTTPPPSSNDGALAAVIASSAQSTTAMMQMMMQQMQAAQAAAQQQTAMMMQQIQTSSQQQLQLFMEMMKSKESASSSGPSQPMPPPPPPENPMGAVKDIISMLGDMGVFGGNGPAPDDTFKQIVLQNQLGVKDVLSLVKEMSPTRDGGGIKEQFENLSVMMNMANQLRQNTEGSPQSTMWDAVGALLSNKDFAGSIASAIRVNTEQVQRQAHTAQQRQMTAHQQALQLAAQQRQQPVAVANPPTRPRLVPKPAPAAVAPAAQAAAPAPVQPSAEEVNAAKQRLQDQGMTAPRGLPPGIESKISDIAEAVDKKDDAEIVQETVNLVMFLHGFEDWQPFSVKLLGAAQAGDKDATLRVLGGFLGGFIELGYMTRDVANQVMRCIDQHFAQIHATLTGKQPETAQPESMLPPGIEEVFTVPALDEIDEIGNPLEEEEDDEESEENEDEDEEGDETSEEDDSAAE